MGQPYVGEIRLFAGNFNPAGWALCNGQPLPISENEVLFQLIGTTYGGDGESTFNLPDLQGRVPVHQGTGSGLSQYIIGETGGVEQVTLSAAQIPIHTHPPTTSGAAGTAATPQGNVLADCSASQSDAYFTPFDGAQAQVTLNNAMIQPAGGSQPHENIQPTLAITYIISLFGVFPSPT